MADFTRDIPNENPCETDLRWIDWAIETRRRTGLHTEEDLVRLREIFMKQFRKIYKIT